MLTTPGGGVLKWFLGAPKPQETHAEKKSHIHNVPYVVASITALLYIKVMSKDF